MVKCGRRGYYLGTGFARKVKRKELMILIWKEKDRACWPSGRDPVLNVQEGERGWSGL